MEIGFSSDPSARVKQLQTANEQPLRLLWCMQRQDAVKLEKHLHRRFKKYQKHGEWFDSTKLTTQQVINECYNFCKYDW